MKWDIPAKGNDITHIRVAVVYRKGNAHWARGYYASVNPVRFDGDYIISPLGKGQAMILAVVNRSNKKVQQSAAAQIQTALDRRFGFVWDMVKAVCDQNNLEMEAQGHG